jgi:hypothetical protein
MKKINKNCLMLMMVLGMVLMGTRASWAYEFTFDHGGLWGQWDGYVNNNTQTDGPDANRNWPSPGGTYSVTTPYSITANTNVNYNYYTTLGSTVTVQVGGAVSVDNPTSTSGNGWVYAEGHTFNPGQPEGIFFQINGGAPGSQVQIDYKWYFNAITASEGTAKISGLAMSVNDNNVWSYPDIILNNYSYNYGSVNSSFMAHSGDIIGIFLNARVSIGDYNDIVYFPLNINNSAALTYLELTAVNPVPVPPSVWLLGSGLLGLAGWRRFRKG